MLLTGVKITDGNVNSWRVQNSWGKTGKLGEGFLIVSHVWFEQHVFQVAVKTRHILGDLPNFDAPMKMVHPWDVFGTVAS